MRKFILAGLLLSSIAGVCTAQWRFTRSSGRPDFMFVHDTTIFVRWYQDGIGAFCPHSDARYYADTGIRPGEQDKLVTGFAAIGDTIFAGGTGLYRSGDNGRHWTATPNMFPYGAQNPIAIDTILLFTYHRTIVRSTDHGFTRTQVSDYAPQVFTATGNVIYAATSSEIIRSTDSGTTWTLAYPSGSDFLVAAGGVVFSGGAHSLDSGKSWIVTDTIYPYSMCTDGVNVFAAGSHTIWASTDLGTHWSTVDRAGLPGDIRFTAMCIFDSFLYVGGYDDISHSGSGLYYRPISEILQKNAVAEHPSSSAVQRMDVYPNPFGTSCTVAFTLAAYSDVHVSLYDATGREVRMVYAGALPPGLNTLPIEASGLPDGIYWCRLESNGTQQLAKLSLIRDATR